MPTSTNAVRFDWCALLVFVATLSLCAETARAQSAIPADQTIDAAMRAQTVQQIGDLLQERYAFPEVAIKCVEHPQARLAAAPFSGILSCDLQSISHDKHLRVRA